MIVDALKKPSVRITIYLVTFFIIITTYYFGRSVWEPIYLRLKGKETVASVIEKYGPGAEDRLHTYFKKANVSYPPAEIKLLALKEEKLVELWVKEDQQYRWVKDFDILAASGRSGPKLKEGDGQVPEGFYRIIGLNPNSGYHLSLKLNYPNQFDLRHAKTEGRDRPGTNIFIHGEAISIGCLAMGNPVIEELFTLVHKTGRSNVEVLIAPRDPRKTELLPKSADPAWVSELYKQLTDEFVKFEKPPPI